MKGRLTDLCEYCEKEILFQKQIVEILKKENIELSDEFNLNEMKNHFVTEARNVKNEIENEMPKSSNRINELTNRMSELKTTIDILRDYEASTNILKNLKKFDGFKKLKFLKALLFHKNVAYCQRLAYNNHHKNYEFLRGKILIEIDYKQKIAIGMSPRQVSSEYYNQAMRSCLGKLNFKTEQFLK